MEQGRNARAEETRDPRENPPPTQAIRVRIPAGLFPDFRMWESCRTMPLVGGFSRGSPVSPASSVRLTSTILIGSQDPAVKIRPNLFTPHKRERESFLSVISQVVDLETGELLGPNKTGELCFRSPLNMKGYLGNLQATIDTIDREGFVHSGDVGYYDDDQYFYVVDRVKELIKYKSFQECSVFLQVPPAELEAVLLSHPSVQDAAVIGIPDDAAGELPKAFVVKQAGANVTEDELIRFVTSQVSPLKRLYGGLHFIDAIPKTASGKILRRDLKNMFISKL
ncbi:hypothetical protein PR048_003814 [Dryococelus australis]|uniref:AMP-binding enzyme C-terminal domain-containing protein n=1 Tax=Dryococelus australis TaxID=614101 RepID=A0ABQ9IP26_9NEOP|nr:hypothetical protein PR048_003814 [Dryococelus australis]